MPAGPCAPHGAATRNNSVLFGLCAFSLMMSPMRDVLQPTLKGLEDELAVLHSNDQNIS